MKPLRLHAHYPSSIKDLALKKPFVTPNVVGTFENYLDLILEEWPESEKERKTLKKNLGYTLQWLEFSSALLLEHYERLRDKKESSLQSTIETMMTLQFCIFTHGVLEGIGSYIFRTNQKSCEHSKKSYPLGYKPWDKQIDVNEWKGALKKKAYPKKENSQKKSDLDKDIQQIVELRDKVHLDTIRSKTHFEDFGRNCFILCHKTLRLILSNLSKRKIGNSPLFEDVEKNLADLISGAIYFDPI